jgi:hypothetical protein
MGKRSLSISLAAGIAVLTSAGHACAQTGSGPTPASGATTTSPANPETPPKKVQRRKADSSTGASPMDAPVAYRPPVRREVKPVARSNKATARGEPSATTAPQTVQTGAPSQAAAGAAERAGAASAAANANGAAASDASAAGAGRKTWPVVVAPSAGAAAGAAVATAQAGTEPTAPKWSEAEIQQAKAHCTSLLRGIDASMAPEDPIKEGECGSPVVFKVSSIGKGPVVELSPPVILTCDMVASLDRWVKREVQPQARSQLGGAIVRIETMSSYSCRNAYGRTKTRLSEHGKANAIDIAGFATAKETTTVLAGWGPTVREQRAIAQRLEAERAAAAAKGPPAAGGAAPPPSIPGVVVTTPGNASGQGLNGLGLAPTRLGGPKAPEVARPTVTPTPGDAASKQRFLKEIHASACKYFGTVLGPEANNAHKNHFHLDMAPRQRGNFCE